MILYHFLIISESFHLCHTLLYLACVSFLLWVTMSQGVRDRPIYARSREGSLWDTTAFIKYLQGCHVQEGQSHSMFPPAAQLQGDRFWLQRKMDP